MKKMQYEEPKVDNLYLELNFCILDASSGVGGTGEGAEVEPFDPGW